MRDIIVSRVAPPESYRKFIAAKCTLTLKDAIKIYQSEDLTKRQVAALLSDLQNTMSAGTHDSAELHKVTPSSWKTFTQKLCTTYTQTRRLHILWTIYPALQEWMSCMRCQVLHMQEDWTLWQGMSHQTWEQAQAESKTLQVKPILGALEQGFEDYMPEYTPIYLTHQISAVPVCKIYFH